VFRVAMFREALPGMFAVSVTVDLRSRSMF